MASFDSIGKMADANDYVRVASWTRLLAATHNYCRITMSDASTSVKFHDELQYLNLIKNVLDTGESRPDRTGTGTISLFAPPSLRFSLANSTLPLITTKRTFLRGIVEELLWFVKGQTDSTLLSQKGVKIWDGNGSKEFLEKRGLGHRRAGDLGPVYGFQWRHFGADYVDADTDYSGKGVDQLREVIRKIKEDPTDRRIIMSAWNPAGLSSTLCLVAYSAPKYFPLQIYHLWRCLPVT